MLSVLVSTVDARRSHSSSRHRSSRVHSAPRPKPPPAPPVDVALKTLETLYKDHKNKIDVNMSNGLLKTAVNEFSEKRVDLILNPPKTYTKVTPFV